MGLQDMEITRDIDRVLVKQDINTQKLRYNCFGGKVRFSGELLRRHGREIDSPEDLKKLEKMIKRIDGVMNVQWDLKNWTKQGGRWVNKKKKRKKRKQREVKYGRSSNVKLEW